MLKLQNLCKILLYFSLYSSFKSTSGVLIEDITKENYSKSSSSSSSLKRISSDAKSDQSVPTVKVNGFHGIDSLKTLSLLITRFVLTLSR